MIPKDLKSWTYESVNKLIEFQINESDIHDFKLNIPDAETLTKVCCAFANSKGGFIILGVKENKKKFDIVGLDNDKELAHIFGQKLKADPTIEFSLPHIIKIPGSNKIIAVIEVPMSPERPHIPTYKEEKRLFYKRTNRGNDYMSYGEIKISFQQLQERQEKLKLLYLELITNRDLLDSSIIKEDQIEDSYSLITLDNQIINSLLTELYSAISNSPLLLKHLIDIRVIVNVMNNKLKIFYNEISLPQTGQNIRTKNHNNFIKGRIEAIRPSIEGAIKILEDEYNLINPLELLEN